MLELPPIYPYNLHPFSLFSYPFYPYFSYLNDIELGTENFAISEIAFAELVFGTENSTNPKKNLELIEIFSNQVLILPIFNAIYLYGKEKARFRSKGLMISDFDLLIGCTAVDKDLVMVTENQKEFERISGIEIENWVKR